MRSQRRGTRTFDGHDSRVTSLPVRFQGHDSQIYSGHDPRVTSLPVRLQRRWPRNPQRTDQGLTSLPVSFGRQSPPKLGRCSRGASPVSSMFSSSCRGLHLGACTFRFPVTSPLAFSALIAFSSGSLVLTRCHRECVQGLPFADPSFRGVSGTFSRAERPRGRSDILPLSLSSRRHCHP